MQFNTSNYINNIEAFLKNEEVDATMVGEDLTIAKKGTYQDGIKAALSNLEVFVKAVETANGQISAGLNEKVIKVREKLLSLAPKKEEATAIESVAKKSLSEEAARTAKETFRASLRKHFAFTEKPEPLKPGTYAIYPVGNEQPDLYYLAFRLKGAKDMNAFHIKVDSNGLSLPPIEKTFKSVDEMIEFLAKNCVEVNPRKLLVQRVASKLDAIRQGIRERHRIVLPSQIFEQLKKELSHHQYSDAVLKEMAFAICREIDVMSANVRRFKGKRLEFVNKASSQTVFTGATLKEDLTDKEGKVVARKGAMITGKLLKKLEKAGVETAALKAEMTKEIKHQFSLQMDEKGKTIKLSIIPNLPSITKGYYKQVFKQHSFTIPLKTEISALSKKRVRTTTHQHEALLKIQHDVDLVSKGIAIQRDVEVRTKDASKVKFTKLPIKISPSETDSKETAYEQELYNGDLYMILTEKVVKDLNGNIIRNITTKDVMDIFVDAAEALANLHQAGYVHRDFYPSNLLIKEKDNKLTGHLHDFDLADKIGTNPQSSSLFYRDKSAKEGFVIPFNDSFALAMSLGEASVVKFAEFRQELMKVKEDWMADELDEDWVDIAKERFNQKINEILNRLLSGDPELQKLFHGKKPDEIQKFDIKSVEAILGKKIENLQKDLLAYTSILNLVYGFLINEDTAADFISKNDEFEFSLKAQKQENFQYWLAKLEDRLGWCSEANLLSELKKIQALVAS